MEGSGRSPDERSIRQSRDGTGRGRERIRAHGDLRAGGRGMDNTAPLPLAKSKDQGGNGYVARTVDEDSVSSGRPPPSSPPPTNAASLEKMRASLKQSRKGYREAKNEGAGGGEGKKEGRRGQDKRTRLPSGRRGSEDENEPPEEEEQYEDDDDNDADRSGEEGPMVFVPKPSLPFGPLGIIQPSASSLQIRKGKQELVEHERERRGGQEEDNDDEEEVRTRRAEVKVLYVPRWSPFEQARLVIRGVLEDIGLIPSSTALMISSPTKKGRRRRRERRRNVPRPGEDGEEAPQEDNEEWLILEEEKEGIYVEKDALVVSRFLDQSRLANRLQRDYKVNGFNSKEKEEWIALTAVLSASRHPEEEKDNADGGKEEEKDRGHRASLLSYPQPPDFTSMVHFPPENPVVDLPSRPDALAAGPVPDHLHTTVIRPMQGALVRSLQGGELVSSGSSPSSQLRHQASLHITIPRLALYDHPLFRPEDEMYAQLKMMFGEYRRRLEETSPTYLLSRVEALVVGINRLEDELGKAKEEGGSIEVLQELKALYDDGIASLLDLAEGEHDFRRLVKALYEMWKDLERERARVGFKRTPARLVAYEAKRSNSINSNKLSIALENAGAGLTWVSQRIETMWKEGAKAYQQDLPDLDYMAFSQVDWEEEINKVQELVGACKAVFPRDDHAEYLLKLTEEDEGDLLREEAGGAITVEEMNRRDGIHKLKYYVVVLLNGQAVASTAVVPLQWPRFILSFNKSLRIWLLRRPQSLCLELRRKMLLMDEVISRIMVPVPGQGADYDHGNTHAIAPKAAWYQFASTDLMGGEHLGSKPCRITGAALVGVEWEASPPLQPSRHEPALLPGRPRPPPPTRMQGLRAEEMIQEAEASSSNAAQGGGHYRIPEFEKQKDFLQMLPDLSHLDPHDPRNTNLLRLRQMLLPCDYQGEEGAGQLRDRFRTIESYYSLSFASRQGQGLYIDSKKFEEPRRHELLGLRRTKPEAFNAPIPLRESDIRADEGYRAIILAERKKREDGGAAERSHDFDARKTVDQAKIKDFVRRVRDSRAATLRRGKRRRLPLGSIVQEGFMPDLRSWTLYEMMDLTRLIPAPRRALRPAPKPRIVTTVNVTSCRILIQVVGARNVPIREFQLAGDARRSEKKKRRTSPSRRSSRHKRGGRRTRDDSDGEEGGGKEQDEEEEEDYDEDEEEEGDEDGEDDSEEDRGGRKRRGGRGASSSSASGGANGSGRVQSFVEIRFQDQVCRTRIAEGRTPTWKDSAELPFTPPMNDFSPGALSQIRDTVTLSLFDNVRIDDRPMGGFYPEEETVRTEKRFLGSLTLPFTTIYTEGCIHGTFRLDAPIVNLGYHQQHPSGGASSSMTSIASASAAVAAPATAAMTTMATSAGGANKGKGLGGTKGQKELKENERIQLSAQSLLRSSESATYVSIMAALDPLLLTPSREDRWDLANDIREERGLIYHAKGWLERVESRMLSLRNRVSMAAAGLTDSVSSNAASASSSSLYASASHKRHHPRLFVPGLDGQRIFIQRYLRPLAPPPGVDTIRQCVRFVSLIPFLEDWQTFVGEGDMWCTAQQFLDILAGDYEEHAVLLHNLLCGRARKAGDAEIEVYLALGQGIPEGQTCYVVTRPAGGGNRNDEEVMLWNPVTGEGYSAIDERCPLQDISVLVGLENLYGNIQAPGLGLGPSKTSFHLENSSLWLPFFTPTTYAKPSHGKLPSVQPPSVRYTPTSKTFVLELEEQILDALKRNVRRWRARRTTTSFNAEVSGRLQELLPTLEKVKRGEVHFSHHDHESKLAPVLRQRDLFGMPLNFPFTDINDIVQRIKSTGTHDTRNPDAQFALAVSIFPYHNNVLSVWVYFAALTPRMTLAK